jgi:hypothetical protein
VSTAAYSWEFTLLRRLPGTHKARVAGRLVIEAPCADDARELAMRELAERAVADTSAWSLGVLKPLTPKAPGTHLFAVTFAVWEATDDRFVRHDIHRLEVWAEDATNARRIAQQDIQTLPGYAPAWRIREVSAVGRRPLRRRRPAK